MSATNAQDSMKVRACVDFTPTSTSFSAASPYTPHEILRIFANVLRRAR